MKKILITLAAALALGACYKPSFPSAMSFALPKTETGAVLDLNKDLAGKPVFIAVMATYCPHCKHSVPQVNALNDKFKDKGLVVLGMFADATPDQIKTYVKEENVNYQTLYNAGELLQQLNVQGVPHFILLDKNHFPVKTWEGEDPTLNRFDGAVLNVLN